MSCVLKWTVKFSQMLILLTLSIILASAVYVIIIGPILLTNLVFQIEKDFKNEENKLVNRQEAEFQKMNKLIKNECAICFVEFPQKKRFKIDCGHDSFHKDCINNWLEKKPNCPLCNKKIEFKPNKCKNKERWN